MDEQCQLHLQPEPEEAGCLSAANPGPTWKDGAWLKGHTPPRCFTRQLAAMSACGMEASSSGEHSAAKLGVEQTVGRHPGRQVGRQGLSMAGGCASGKTIPQAARPGTRLHHHAVKVLRFETT